MKDLAEHIIITLAARSRGSADDDSDDCSTDTENRKWCTSNWLDEEITLMKQSISTFMEVAGEPTHKAQHKSISDIIDAFVLGTEQRKEWIQCSKLSANPSAVVIIANMRFLSTTKMAK